MKKVIDIKYEIDKRTKEWKNLIYDGCIFASPIDLIKYCIEQGEKQAKRWCPECNGEDEASVCKWCYADAIETGKNQVKDIKADHLAGHYIAGKEEGRKKAIAEEIKFLEYLIESYFLVCVGESPQTPRTDILLRIKTLKNENIKKGVSRSKVNFKGWEKNGKNK